MSRRAAKAAWTDPIHGGDDNGHAEPEAGEGREAPPARAPGEEVGEEDGSTVGGALVSAGGGAMAESERDNPPSAH